MMKYVQKKILMARWVQLRQARYRTFPTVLDLGRQVAASYWIHAPAAAMVGQAYQTFKSNRQKD
jgi:hypothetical protein